MKHIIWTLSIILILGLTSCTGTATPAPLPTVMLDSATSTDSSSRTVSASATIVPATHAQLSFALSGRVASVEVKVGDKVSAGDILAILDTTALDAQVASAVGTLQSAQADLDLLKRFGEVLERIEAAEGRVAQAQAALDIAKANLSAATLAAPFDATVVEAHLVVGENASPNQIVFILGDLRNFTVETSDLSERDVTKIRVDQSATVYVEALDLEIPATVSAISPVADTLGGDVIYKVTLELSEQPAGAMWGMSAEVEIVIE